MTTQPEALRLADALQQQAVWEGHYGPSYLRDLLPEAAAELRRQHEENERLAAEVANRNRRALAGDEAVAALANVHAHYEGLEVQRDALLEALKELLNAESSYPWSGWSESELAAIEKARAAIAQAEENT